MKAATSVLAIAARILFVLAILLIVDLLCIRFLGNEYGQTPTPGGVLGIWFTNVLFAVGLAVVVGILGVALSRVAPRRTGGSEKRTSRAWALFVGLLVALAAYAKMQLFDQGWRTSFAVAAMFGVAAFGVAALRPVRFRAWHLAAVHAVLVGVLLWIQPRHRDALAESTPQARAAELPNIFLIVVDTVRADHVSAYGSARETTPNLDRFAAQAVRFDQAYSGSAATSPSTAALLGSPFPYTNDFVENGRKAIFTTLPGFLHLAGYETAAFSANPWVSRAMGFDRGFEHFRNLVWIENEFSMNHLLRGLAAALGHPSPDFLNGKALNADAMKWLRGRTDDRPVFCYMHYMDPHYPYTPAREFRERVSPRPSSRGERYPMHLARGRAPFVDGATIDPQIAAEMIALYDAEIMQWDAAFEEFRVFLEKSGWLENSIVIVTADHGEAFYEHRVWGHGNSLYNEIIRVPLVIRRPGGAGPGVVTRPVSNTRITQLLKAIVEAEPLERGALDFASLLTQEEGRVVAQFSSSAEEYSGSAVLDGMRKSIVMRKGDETRHSLYEIDRDPLEREDRIAASGGLPSVAPGAANSPDAASDSLVVVASACLPLAPDQMPQVEVSEERRELLKSLGYVE